jgi:hypothetical protein
MGELIFLCPQSAREIETGIKTDAASLARSRRKMMRIECPHCHVTHAFKIADGWVDHYARCLPSVDEPV